MKAPEILIRQIMNDVKKSIFRSLKHFIETYFNRVKGFRVTNDLSGVAEHGINNTGANNEIVDNYIYNVKKIGINSSGDGAYIADNKILFIQKSR